MRKTALVLSAISIWLLGCRSTRSGADDGRDVYEAIDRGHGTEDPHEAERGGETHAVDASDDAEDVPVIHLDGVPDEGLADLGEDEPSDEVTDAGAGLGEPCWTGEECASGLFCDDDSGVCAECRESRDCAVGKFCLDKACIPWLCVPGSASCEGSILKTCGPDGEGFVSERDCDDSDVCTVGDGCENRRCVAGVPLDCDDGNPCTSDACEPGLGCVHGPVEGVACDDQNPCTTGDTCTLGGCIGAQRDCSDGNLCTDDFCEPERGCVYRPNQAWCDDQDQCTWGDRCELGVCRGIEAVICDDGDPCTLDRCESGNCIHLFTCWPCLDNAQCDDGNACSLDACISGSCEHVVSTEAGCCASDEDCSDQDECTTETCVGAPFGTCRRRAVYDKACCLVETFSATFQGGEAQGFIFEPPQAQVGWHLLKSGYSTSPPWSLYYGNPQTLDYSTGVLANSGSLWTPEILLPARVGLTFRFWVWMDVQPSENLDILTVTAHMDLGEFVLWKKPPDHPMTMWKEVVVDISALQSRPVRFEFRFDTRDGLGNSGRGVYLDDILVRSTCKPVACVTDLDCRSVGFLGTCLEGWCDFHEVLRVVQVFGAPGVGPGQFRFPFDVATGLDLVLVSDKDNHRVQVFDLAGNFRFSFGTKGSGNGQFQSPHGVAFSRDRVLVADTKNHRVQVFTPMGVFLFAFGSQGTEPGRFYEPKDVAVTEDGGTIYVADTSNHRIQVFDANGIFAYAFGRYGKKPGEFRSPSCVLSAPGYKIIVCDVQNHRVQVLTWQGEPVASLQATGDLALNNPYGAVLRPDGSFVVSDTLQHRLVMFSADGVPSAVFGTYGTGFGQFRYPMGATLGADGRLFVVDASNHRIAVVTKTAFP